MKKPATHHRTVKRHPPESVPDFRDLVENSVEGVLIHRNFKPLYVNKAFADLFGYASPDEIMLMPILRPLVPTERWAMIEEEYDALIRGQKPFSITRARGIKKDGTEIWTSTTQKAVTWEGKKAIHLTAFDITSQMTMEQTLLKSEQHLRALLDILPQPIYITNQIDGKLLYVNRKTCLLFQRRASQLLRGTSADFYVNTQDREELRKLFENLKEIRDVEVKMKNFQGREFTAEVAAISVDYGGSSAILVALNDISQRKELEAELFHQASTDPLTGISNRRYFITQAEQELRRSRRFGRNLSVLMIDVDHFKIINDRHGHAVGDAVLQGVVKRCLESLRQSDLLGRLGGEEFAVILPETNLAAATEAAERLRRHMEERPLIAERIAIACTVSVGVAELNASDGSIDDLLHRADETLYRAKNKGRNRVEVAQ